MSEKSCFGFHKTSSILCERCSVTRRCLAVYQTHGAAALSSVIESALIAMENQPVIVRDSDKVSDLVDQLLNPVLLTVDTAEFN